MTGSTKNRPHPAILALALAAALSGCGKSGTAGKDSAGGDASYQLSESNGQSTLTVRSDKGTARIVSGTGDAALPAGLSLYPGATVTSSTRITGEATARSTILSFDTPDMPAQVIAYYKAGAQKAGYAVDAEVKAGTMEMLNGKHGKEGGFTLTANREGGKTVVSLLGSAGAQ
ncbi:MAG: hypothetical protein QHC65_02630 [Sphingomonas sp.]|nr:hypothetical protein [Sphingomonas sp.]MDX3883291.1 hypothetical protein [Sphingomonas sp.]